MGREKIYIKHVYFQIAMFFEKKKRLYICVCVRANIHTETDHFAQVSTSLLSLMGEYTEIKKHYMPFIQYYKILVINCHSFSIQGSSQNIH